MPYKDPEAKRKRDAEYRAAHKEQIRTYQAEYRSLHGEEKRTYSADYYATHKAEFKDRARRRSNTDNEARTRHQQGRVAEAKSDGCADCGTNESLQFHHLDPGTKSFNVAEMAGRSDEVFWSEVAKCVVVCRPCHNARHKKPPTKGNK